MPLNYRARFLPAAASRQKKKTPLMLEQGSEIKLHDRRYLLIFTVAGTSIADAPFGAVHVNDTVPFGLPVRVV
jgi:hypothetical protein